MDYSINSTPNPDFYLKNIDAVLRQSPEISEGVITVANFNAERVLSELIPLVDHTALSSLIKNISFPREGRLDVDRVIKKELLRSFRQNLNPGDWQRYPIFVVITNNQKDIFPPQEMEFFSAFLPDCNFFFVVGESGTIEKKTLWGTTINGSGEGVIVLKTGQSIALWDGESDQLQSIFLKEEKNSGQVSFFSPGEKRFVPVSHLEDLPGDSPYVQSMDLFFQNLSAILNPAELNSALAEIVQTSRSLSVLVPSTSFIVVERKSQRKTLAVKEHQRLRSSGGLEFDEFKTPVPATWLLIVLGSIAYWFCSKLRHIQCIRKRVTTISKDQDCPFDSQ